MIRIAVFPAPQGFASRLAARAAAFAVARAEAGLRARRADGSHWRAARLLWPDFASRS